MLTRVVKEKVSLKNKMKMTNRSNVSQKRSAIMVKMEDASERTLSPGKPVERSWRK